jgi:hypothetical protein
LGCGVGSSKFERSPTYVPRLARLQKIKK